MWTQNTDLSFIMNEVALMDGDYTIDLIKRPDKGELHLKVLAALEDLGLSKIPSSGKQRVIESDEGTVVYNYLKGVPQVFSFNDFKEIATPGMIPKETNKLHTLGYSAETCVDDPLRFQLRVYTRQLNQALSSKATALPVVVHDASGWLETDTKLDKEVELIVSKGAVHHDSFFQPSKMISLNHVLPRYIGLMKHLESLEKKDPSSDL
ncbi:Uncharacterised protein [Legionella steigerwaltii]|uniref:Uncharacterized protein n=1 Tax=Legionella steigerwaltii TaxID=460 RepID=A0A378L7M2_9GAMM|nr:hypothetical protein [Legionella steigerwaltii]KTD72013.1 hypothetical protein Lstg_2714 [Legionella steigerwaltii]STY21679.1 Uncharacterised protein [Legionella steigerwaltii]